MPPRPRIGINKTAASYRRARKRERERERERGDRKSERSGEIGERGRIHYYARYVIPICI